MSFLDVLSYYELQYYFIYLYSSKDYCLKEKGVTK